MHIPYHALQIMLPLPELQSCDYSLNLLEEESIWISYLVTNSLYALY